MAAHLAAGKTQLEAHQLAGFTGRSSAAATQIANRPEMLARVQEILATQHRKEIRSNERAIERAGIDKDYIITRLQYAAEFGLRGKPLLDENGRDTGRWSVKPDIRGATAALRTLAQMGGHLIERHEVGGPGDFARMTEEELNAEMITIGERIGLPRAELLKIAGPRSD